MYRKYLWRSLGCTLLPGVPNRSLMTVLVCDECGLIGNSILPFRSFHLEPRQASLGSDHSHPCATPGIDFVHPTPQMVQRSSTATVVVWGKLHGFPGWNTSNYTYRSSISPKTLVVACSCLFFSVVYGDRSCPLCWNGRDVLCESLLSSCSETGGASEPWICSGMVVWYSYGKVLVYASHVSKSLGGKPGCPWTAYRPR